MECIDSRGTSLVLNYGPGISQPAARTLGTVGAVPMVSVCLFCQYAGRKAMIIEDLSSGTEDQKYGGRGKD